MYVCISCIKKELVRKGIKPFDYHKFYVIVLNSKTCERCGAKEVKVDWIKDKGEEDDTRKKKTKM